MNMLQWFQIALGFLGVFALLLIFFLLLFALFFKKEKEDKNAVQIKIKNYNLEKEEKLNSILSKILPEEEEKKRKKEKKKQADSKNTSPKPRLFVMDFIGDIHASGVSILREQISLVLEIAKPEDQVLLRLESAGGVVHGYGLCASQLARLRARKIELIVCIDKIAASGGYMMASLANTIVAAPFAIVGSIGVVAQIPNFNRLLKENNVDYLEMTAGEYKRTLTMLGEVTEKGKNKFQEQLEQTHTLFQNHIEQYRPKLSMTDVATGEYWYGSQAFEKNLVDSISTSDDILQDASKNKDIFILYCQAKTSLIEKISQFFASQKSRSPNHMYLL
jgi:serine protease SohB